MAAKPNASRDSFPLRRGFLGVPGGMSMGAGRPPSGAKGAEGTPSVAKVSASLLRSSSLSSAAASFGLRSSPSLPSRLAPTLTKSMQAARSMRGIDKDRMPWELGPCAKEELSGLTNRFVVAIWCTVPDAALATLSSLLRAWGGYDGEEIAIPTPHYPTTSLTIASMGTSSPERTIFVLHPKRLTEEDLEPIASLPWEEARAAVTFLPCGMDRYAQAEVGEAAGRGESKSQQSAADPSRPCPSIPSTRNARLFREASSQLFALTQAISAARHRGAHLAWLAPGMIFASDPLPALFRYACDLSFCSSPTSLGPSMRICLFPLGKVSEVDAVVRAIRSGLRSHAGFVSGIFSRCGGGSCGADAVDGLLASVLKEGRMRYRTLARTRFLASASASEVFVKGAICGYVSPHLVLPQWSEIVEALAEDGGDEE